MKNYLLKIKVLILPEKETGIKISKIEKKNHKRAQEYQGKIFKNNTLERFLVYHFCPKKQKTVLQKIFEDYLFLEVILKKFCFFKITSKNFFLVVCLFLCSLSLAQNIEQKGLRSILLSEKTLISENISYKNDANRKEIRLDLYRPQNSSSEKLPVVIYIHGGGWVEGDKTIQANSYIENAILKLVEKKYAVISIDYRLVSETVHFPKPVEDCKDVIRWVRKNAVKYHFDINNIGLFGTSAGAHLALLSAYTNDNDFVGSPELAQYSAKVNYVVDQFGPTDINKLLLTRIGEFPIWIMDVFSKETVNLREKLINGISGFNINKDKKKIVSYFKTISPLNYIDNAVPTLIQQGNSDKIVPFKQSKKLHRKLNKLKIQNYFTVVENGVHGFKTTDQKRLDEIVEELVGFIVSQKK